MYPHCEIKFSATICSCFERKPLGEYVTQPSVKKTDSNLENISAGLAGFFDPSSNFKGKEV